MRPAHPSAALVSLISLGVCSMLYAQIAPPNQDFVADIGNAPLKAPANADFAPGNSFTMEGWVFLAGKVSGAWIMGKGLDTNGVDP